MKKFIAILCTISLSSNILNIVSLPNISNNSNNQYLLDSKYAAMANIIGSNQNLNVNDLLSLEESNNNTIPINLRNIFSDPYNVNNMLSSGSEIPYYDNGQTKDPNNFNKILQIINTFKDANASTIMNLTLLTNFTNLFGQTFGSIFNNTNLLSSIIDSIPLNVFIESLKNFGTYNSETKQLEITKNSIYYGLTYNDIFQKIIDPKFENSVLNIATNLAAFQASLTSDIQNFVNGLLMLFDFISQFDYNNTTWTPKEDQLFSSNDGSDYAYKYEILNSSFKIINTANINNLIVGINNSDENSGISFRKLMFAIFGMTSDEIVHDDMQRNTHDANNDFRINVKYIGINHMAGNTLEEMPGTYFAYNDPAIQIINDILEATITYLNKTGKMSTSYEIIINKEIRKSIARIFITNAHINLIRDIIGPLLYQMFNDISENLDIDATIDSLTILSSSLSSLSSNTTNLNDDIKKLNPWKSPFDSCSITTQIAYPLAMPTLKVLKYKLGNYDWNYQNYNANYLNENRSPNSTSWNSFWSGMNDNSLITSFLNVLQDMMGALSLINNANKNNTTPTLPNIINLQTEINLFLNKKINHTTTIKELLQLIDDNDGIINTFLTNYGQINNFFTQLCNSLIAQKSAASTIFEKYVDVNKALEKKDNTLYMLLKDDDTLKYLDAIYYAINKNYLVDNVDLNALNFDMYKLFGYDHSNNNLTENSFIDIFFKNRNLITLFTPAIQEEIDNSNNQIFSKALSEMKNWTTSNIIPITKTDVKYTLINPDGTHYTVELDIQPDQFYKMFITHSEY